MAMLDENTMKKVKEALSGMKNPVKLVIFRSKSHESGGYMEQLAKELAEANKHISVHVRDFDTDKESGFEYAVSQPSTMCIVGKEKRHIKVLGIPAGYEFAPFLQTILDVSKGSTDLPKDMEARIKEIDFPVTMKVFVTPTCPYCPGAARLAHIMALINPNIHGEMVEANEFPELSQKYQVSGVPKTVINDTVDLVGAYPAEIVLKKISELKA